MLYLCELCVQMCVWKVSMGEKKETSKRATMCIYKCINILLALHC